MDPITDIFRTMHVTAFGLNRLEATAPWGVIQEKQTEEKVTPSDKKMSPTDFTHHVATRPPGSKNRAIDIRPIDCLRYYFMGRMELMPGTLDMLILTTLTRAPLHGYRIAQSIKQISDDVTTVEEGSLYPALQHLLLQGWAKAEWRRTETNRRARFYTLAVAGKKQLGLEVSQFRQVVAAIGRVLEDVEEAG